MQKRLRLDHYIYTHHSITPEKTHSLIIQGKVYVNNHKITKPGHFVKHTDTVTVRDSELPYVSRGGLKLAGAFNAFTIPIKDKICLDIGLSTGGFTDYLLQQDAHHVIGVDVAYGNVDLTIRNHPKTTIIERCNARTLKLSSTAPTPITLVVMDVSFISITKILPTILPQVDATTDFVILVKPQFEAPKHLIPTGGVIKDPHVIQSVLSTTEETLLSIGLKKYAECPSPIKGAKGNQEHFFWLKSYHD